MNDAVSHSKVLKGSAYGRFYNALAIGSNKASGYDDLDVLYSCLLYTSSTIDLHVI